MKIPNIFWFISVGLGPEFETQLTQGKNMNLLFTYFYINIVLKCNKNVNYLLIYQNQIFL